MSCHMRGSPGRAHPPMYKHCGRRRSVHKTPANPQESSQLLYNNNIPSSHVREAASRHAKTRSGHDCQPSKYGGVCRPR